MVSVLFIYYFLFCKLAYCFIVLLLIFKLFYIILLYVVLFMVLVYCCIVAMLHCCIFVCYINTSLQRVHHIIPQQLFNCNHLEERSTLGRGLKKYILQPVYVLPRLLQDKIMFHVFF